MSKITGNQFVLETTTRIIIIWLKANIRKSQSLTK